MGGGRDADANGAGVSRSDAHEFQWMVTRQASHRAKRDSRRPQPLAPRLAKRLEIDLDFTTLPQFGQLVTQRARSHDLPAEMDKCHQRCVDQQQRGEARCRPAG